VNKPKHTKGPWQVCVTTDTVYTGDKWLGTEKVVGETRRYSVVAPEPATSDYPGGVLIAEINDSYRHKLSKPADPEADARVMAASAELLEACRMALARLNKLNLSDSVTMGVIDRLLKAIDKAEPPA